MQACGRSEATGEALLGMLPQRVLVVADDAAHATKLHADLQAAGLPASEVFLIGGKDSDKAARFKEGECTHPSVRVAVVPKTLCEGWDGTHFTVLLRGVYFGNQASRSQMEGRIDRLSSVRKVRYVRTYAAGVQERFLVYQQKASSLAKAIQLACPAGAVLPERR